MKLLFNDIQLLGETQKSNSFYCVSECASNIDGCYFYTS